jgi:hypothetical protein
MLQETHTTTPYTDGSSRQSFALQQYNKAISCMLDQMTVADSKPLGPLLTCVLFVCIEFMQNKDKESLIHLEQGRQILKQLETKASSASPEMDMIKQHLVPMYTRLSITSFMFGGNPVAIPSELKTIKEVPCVFESIDEAQYCLYDFMDECMRFTRRTRIHRTTNIPPESGRTLEQEQNYLMGKLAKIDVAYSLYQASKPTDAQEGAIKLLQIHLHLNRICVATALSGQETVFDAHLPTFAAIVPLASAFLDASKKSSPTDGKYSAATGNPVHPSGRRSMFSFGLHVIAPLYYVTTKCRHPIIRRAALDLLRQNPSRRENLWRANIMAEIAARIIKLEDQSVVPAGSISPPFHPIPDPFSQGVTPEIIWATSLAEQDFPRPGSGSMFEHLGPDPWFDMKPHRLSEFADVTASMSLGSYSIPSLAGDSISGSADMDMPIDPSILLDATETSSLHSFSSLDDFSGEPSPHMPYSTITSSSTPATSNLPWQPIPCGPAAPSISLEPPTPIPGVSPYEHLPRTMHMSATSLSQQHQRMSSSAPSEDEGMSDRSTYSGTAVQRQDSNSFSGKYASDLCRDAPFDLPENVRVHDVIIGPEKEDGTWIMMFRKLGGLDAEWDVSTEFVAI